MIARWLGRELRLQYAGCEGCGGVVITVANADWEVGGTHLGWRGSILERGWGVAVRAMTGIGTSGTVAVVTGEARTGVAEVDIPEGGAAERLAGGEVAGVLGGVGSA